MEIRLDNKVAIVTGGRQGVGHAITERFLAEGASVLTCARDRDGLDAVVDGWRQTHGERIAGIRADVSRLADVEHLLEVAQRQFGGVDILVNNAATSQMGTLESLSEEQWRSEVDVKLMSMVRTARLAVPLMRERGGGSIINVNAIFARQPDMGFNASSVVRAGCLSLTKLIAKEYGKDNIRANAIGIGLAATPPWQAWHDPAKGSFEDFLAECAAQYGVPMQRIGDPAEVANVALFLASELSSYVSGTQIDVDGGLAAYL